MTSLLDFLRLLRYGQARLSVAYHLHDLDRARAGLAKAYAAHDAALAELHIHALPLHDSERPIPASLLKREEP